MVLCSQSARVAVWAEDGSLGPAPPVLAEHEARRRSETHAIWATRAAALWSLDAEDEEALLAAQQFCAAAEAPLDVRLRQLAGEHHDWMKSEIEGIDGAEFDRAYDAVKGEWSRNRPMPTAVAWARRARNAAMELRRVGGVWDGTADAEACVFTGLSQCNPTAGCPLHLNSHS